MTLLKRVVIYPTTGFSGITFLRFSLLSLQIAKVEKLKPLEVELRRLEDLSESIVNDFAYMKKREEEMRDTNGKKTVIPEMAHK